jgi:hypothetical protein
MAVSESTGISSNTEGKAFYDGVVWQIVGVYDLDLKAETGSVHGYAEGTDRDGDKVLHRWEGRAKKGKDWGSGWGNKFTLLRGTGKYEGIRVEGTTSVHYATPLQKAPKQGYEDWELEVEYPR